MFVPIHIILQRNWNEDKAKAGRIELDDGQVKGLVSFITHKFLIPFTNHHRIEKLNTSISQKKWKKHQADVEGNMADSQPKGLVSYLVFLFVAHDCHLILTYITCSMSSSYIGLPKTIGLLRAKNVSNGVKMIMFLLGSQVEMINSQLKMVMDICSSHRFKKMLLLMLKNLMVKVVRN